MPYEILEPPAVDTEGQEIARRILGVRSAFEASQPRGFEVIEPAEEPLTITGDRPPAAGYEVLEQPQGGLYVSHFPEEFRGAGPGYEVLEGPGEPFQPRPTPTHPAQSPGQLVEKPSLSVPMVGTAQTLADALDVLGAQFRRQGLIAAPGKPGEPAPRSLEEIIGELPTREPTTAENIATGALNVPSQTLEGLSSPKNLALVAGTAGLGGAPAGVKALVSAAFAADMARATPELIDNYQRAKASGDAQKITEAAGHLLVNTAMVAGAGAHGAREGVEAFRREPVSGKAGEPEGQTTPTHPLTGSPTHETADVSKSALEELQAAMQAGQIRKPNAEGIRVNQGQPAAPGQTVEGSQGRGGANLQQPAPGQPESVGAGKAAPGNAPAPTGRPLTPEEAAEDAKVRALVAD